MKHLCILPFIHLSTKPEGAARYCCFAPYNRITKPDGAIYNFGHDDIKDIWNSEHARNMRQRMINGEKIEECRFCWKEEEVGKTSKRMRENSNYFEQFKDRVEYAKNHDGKLDDNLPVYLDLRPGNLCNLKCRSCNSLFSSSFAKEVSEKWDKDLSFYAQYKRNKILIDDWSKTPTFWNNLDKLLPNLEHIYISGGEPLINKDLLKLLVKCVDENYAKNILLRLNTNLTVMHPEFYDIFSKFKRVSLGPSLDAFGNKVTYIRHPLTWETAEKNLIKFMQLPSNVGIDVNCTVTLMNVMYLDDLYLYLNELSIKYNKHIHIVTEMAHEPKFLNVNILHPELKQEIRQRNLKLLNKIDFNPNQINAFNAVLDLMDQTPDDVDELRSEFKLFTNNLDKIRSEKFADVFPELRKMIDE